MQSKLEKKIIKNKLQGLTNYKKYNKVSRFTVTVRLIKKSVCPEINKSATTGPFRFVLSGDGEALIIFQ